MKNVLVTGSIAYDILLGYEGIFADSIDPKALDSLSLSFFSPRYVRRHGGTGANIAWGLKILGIEPVLVSSIGDDGAEYIEKLRGAGIGTDFIEVIGAHATATAIVNTDSAESQIAFYHPGADSKGRWPENIPTEGISCGIISPRDTVAMSHCANWSVKNSVPFFFDPGQQIIAFSDDELHRMVDMSKGVFVNEYEWEVLQKKLGMDEGGLLEITPFVIVTMGDRGSLAVSRGGCETIPACKPEKVVNPTGAGDAFRAGFIAGICEGKDLKCAGVLGSAMGAAAVEREGTLLEGVTAEDVKARTAL